MQLLHSTKHKACNHWARYFKEIQQTSMFLNKKNLEVYCIDFKYFKTNKGERIITSNFIVKGQK